jgi:predicted 2-oxoglutarate/Fe(II)-dependent dioxygenase YbiX
LPLEAEEGLLIAFPAGVLHEVTPVLRGSRYTLATWYY